MAKIKKAPIPRGSFFKERNNVLGLLAKNQNYFGTVAASKLKAAKLLSHNVFYEELSCVGYNPVSNDLFATFELKRSFGYSGNLCTKGSREYVRFFIDYGTGAGWEDQGMVAVNVHDIPTEKDCFKDLEKPLCYTASIPLKDVKRRFCNTEVLPRVCAILSWALAIPPDHNFNPIWGNKLICQIQLNPFIFPWITVMEANDIFVPKFLDIAQSNPELTVNQVTELANEDTTDETKSLADYQTPELHLSEIAKLYKAKRGFSVAPLRFTLPTLLQLKNNPQDLEITSEIFNDISGLNLADLFGQLDKTKANTNFEELECLGLDYNKSRLAATFRVKLQGGYAGNLCKKGSYEHVAFWADWDDDCKWTYLGTSSVNVHDLKNIDKKGACYTAFLPVDMDKFRQVCSKPKVVRIRAVLSWSSLPSTFDPNDLNTFGNRLDTHIQLKPLKYAPGVYPLYTSLGGIAIEEIHDITGLTLPGATFDNNGLFADSQGRPCPFAKRVVVTGPPRVGHRYRIQVRKVGTILWTDVITPIKVTPFFGPKTFHNPGLDHYFDYLPVSQNSRLILGWWDTSGNDKWEVKLDIQGIAGSFSHVIQLNHTGPTADIKISGAGVVGAGDCKDYFPGDNLDGTFVARSSVGYHGHYSLGSSVPTPNPADRIKRDPVGSIYNQTAPSPGDNWKMRIPPGTQKCGYYVSVSVVDRTVINSAYTGFWDHDTAGFCVR